MQKTSLQSRSIYHDLLRILATFSVICIHVCAESATWTSHNYSSPIWTVLNVFNSTSRFAVPVFVMLSGSFMIDKYQSCSYKKFYIKNIGRLVSAFVVWSIIYVGLKVVKDLFIHSPLNIKDLIHQLFQGYVHLWFIPMIIFMYAITPLLYELCKEKRTEQYFLVLAFIPMIFNFINSFITVKPMSYLFDKAGFQFVSGYTIYYILGHYLTKYDICKKLRIFIYFSAITSIVLTVWLSHRHYNSGNTNQHYVYEYLSTSVFVVAVAVFLFFKYVFSKIKFKKRSQKVIVMLSSLTFGIYLSHMIFVIALTKTPLTVENIHPIISVPFIVIIVFVISALTTWVISKIPILKKYTI